MPEPRIIRVYYEGDDDRTLLEGLKSVGLIRGSCEIAKRSKDHPGQDGLITELAAFVRPSNGVSGSAVAIFDLDDRSPEQLFSWVQRRLSGEMPPGDEIRAVEPEPANPRVRLLVISKAGHVGQVALVAAGLPENSTLKTAYGIERFAMDDHLFQLICDPQAYDAVPDFQDVPHPVALKKLDEFTGLLRNNEIPIRQSKRLLHLVRAVTGFRPSSAEFVHRLVTKSLEKVGTDRIRQLMHPLVDDLQFASSLLSS